jgi:pimeloyl-ACP methyl ester carboxylesterase
VDDTTMHRETVDVDCVPLSYLCSGNRGAEPLLLVHGTFWSRVWAPVLPALGGRHIPREDSPAGVADGSSGTSPAGCPGPVGDRRAHG